MEETNTKFKLKCVLLELMKTDYKVTDDTVLEKLITHLSVKEIGQFNFVRNFTTALLVLTYKDIFQVPKLSTYHYVLPGSAQF